MAYIARISYFDPDTEAESTRLYSTRGFVTRGSDTPAHTVAEARIVTPVLVRRDVFDIGTTGGASRVGFGELTLRNDDGGLDWLLDVATDGRSLDVFDSGDDDEAAFPDGFTRVVAAVVEQVEVTATEARFRLRDRQVFATRFVQPNRFGGTNVLPNGLDGITSDLKAKPKPVLYGYALNIAPPCVNTSRQVYQVNDGAIRDILAVYDSGALLSRTLPDYDDEAQLFAEQPQAGTYRVWKAGGMFRLRSTPVGEVTCDAVEGRWPRDRTAAQIFRRLLVERAGLDLSAVSSADVDALDAKQPATVGLWLDTDVPVAAALDTLTQSVGAWWGADASGTLRVQRLEAPTEPVVATFDADNIVRGTLLRVPTNDSGLPAFRVTVRAVRNYTVQTSGLVGSVGAARRARLAQPYQDAVAENLAMRDVHLLAPERVVLTTLACLPAAQLEATRQLALYGVRRDRFELTARLSAVQLAAIDLGVCVRLQAPRFGLDAGRVMRVLGYQLNPVEQSATFTLWG